MIMLVQIVLIWLVVGAVLFCLLAVLTPNNELDRASLGWMAATAFLWPFILLYILIGAVIAVMEILFGNHRV